MGIGKSKIAPSIDVDDMFKKAEINHEIEAEKQDADKRLAEVREAKEALLKIHQDLQDAIKAERDAAISDLETIMAYGGGNLDTCQYCKNGQCYARGGTKLCLPQWRGQKED